MSPLDIQSHNPHQLLASTPVSARNNTNPSHHMNINSSHSKIVSSLGNKTLCDCAICRDEHGDFTNATNMETAARMFRRFNRSILGDLAKFCVTILVAILVGYYALRRDVDGLKQDVASMRQQNIELQSSLTSMQQQNAQLQGSLLTSIRELDFAKEQIRIISQQVITLNNTATDATVKLSSLPYDELLQRSISISSNLKAVTNASAVTAAQLATASTQLTIYSSNTTKYLNELLEAAQTNISTYVEFIPQWYQQQDARVNRTLQQFNQSITSTETGVFTCRPKGYDGINQIQEEGWYQRVGSMVYVSGYVYLYRTTFVDYWTDTDPRRTYSQFTIRCSSTLPFSIGFNLNALNGAAIIDLTWQSEVNPSAYKPIEVIGQKMMVDDPLSITIKAPPSAQITGNSSATRFSPVYVEMRYIFSYKTV